MRYHQIRLTAVSGILLASTACHETRIEKVPVPPELTTCMAEPEAPVIPARDGTDATQLQRDKLTLGYILGLIEAGGDCRSRVAGVRAWNAP